MGELDDLRRLSEAATPGPWRYAEPPYYIVDADGEHVHSDAEGLGANYANDATRDLIVASVNYVRKLVSREAHDRVCACPFDGTDPDCNYVLMLAGR